MTILVTGATGHIGGRVAQLLAERGVPARRLVRDLAKAAPLQGSPVVQGDYADRNSLAEAMIGVDTVFLTSIGAEPMKRAKLHGAVMDAAGAAGVARLVYLSFQGASATSPFPYSADHLLSEAHLKQSGMAWTILRDSFYLDLLPSLADADGVIRSPDLGGKTAWVAREDVAQSVTAVLTSGSHENRTYDITGPEAISLQDATERLATISGRPFRYIHEGLDQGRAWRAATGAPSWEVDVWLGSYLAMGSGELSTVSNDVERLTLRRPLTLEDALAGR